MNDQLYLWFYIMGNVHPTINTVRSKDPLCMVHNASMKEAWHLEGELRLEGT